MWKRAKYLAIETAKKWSADEAPRMAAALAYYTVFSMAPILIIAIGIASMVFSAQAATGEIFAQIRGVVGDQGASAIQQIIQNTSQQKNGSLATILGIVTLLLGASGVFGELRASLNKIWKTSFKKSEGVKGFLRDRLLSFAMVLAIGFLLVVSLIVSAVVAAVANFLGQNMQGTASIWQLLNFVVSFFVITLLFGLIFKFLPNQRIKWGEVVYGSILTSLLFTIGKTLIGVYLGKSTVTSAFGAAGSLVIVLVWVYYSAQILFLGAEFTYIHSSSKKSKEVSDRSVNVNKLGTVGIS